MTASSSVKAPHWIAHKYVSTYNKEKSLFVISVVSPKPSCVLVIVREKKSDFRQLLLELIRVIRGKFIFYFDIQYIHICVFVCVCVWYIDTSPDLEVVYIFSLNANLTIFFGIRNTLYFNFRNVFLDIADFLLHETSEINLFLNEETENSIKSYKENFWGKKILWLPCLKNKAYTFSHSHICMRSKSHTERSISQIDLAHSAIRF